MPELSALVGESSAMRKLLRYARQAAQSPGPILLRGEEEVGKAQLAEAIHFGSEQAAGPLVTLNCQALPSERMALELMGSDEAGQERAGKFELAHGGTLVLEQGTLAEHSRVASLAMDKLQMARPLVTTEKVITQP